MSDPNISFLTQAIGALPFCSVAGKVPQMNFSRLLEAFIIAGVTLFGTVQALSSEMKALSSEMKAMAKVTDELRLEVTQIRLERAGRVKHIDATLNELDRITKDHEARLRKAGK